MVARLLHWAFPPLLLALLLSPPTCAVPLPMSQTLRLRDDITQEGSPACGDGTSSEDLPLRIASIFVILVGASFGTLFPVLSRRTKYLRSRIPKGVFDTAKYFGSGVIIATAFIHLLSPAIDELGSPCLSPAWSEYPYALALALLSIFLIFIVELIAMRWGTAKLSALGLVHDPHASSHAHPPLCLESSEPVGSSATAEDQDLPYHTHHPAEKRIDSTPVGDNSDQLTVTEREKEKEKSISTPTLQSHSHSHSHGDDLETASHHTTTTPAMASAQLVGIAILEFGVLLHSFLIGLTLAVTENFKILFIVLVFHQTFEGLGVGSRLAYLDLSSAGPRWSYVPIYAAILFGVTTPIGIAIGLGIRETYNPGSATASIVSGVLDAFSAGVLIYTGLVELLAHDFLFNPAMIQHASNTELAFAVGSVMLGCGLMALLGRWA